MSNQVSNLQAAAFVMNTPAAADFSILGGVLNVDGLNLDIPYEDARLLTLGDSQGFGGVRGLERSRIAQTKIFTVTFAATNSTAYSFVVSGINTQTQLADSFSVSYTSDATATLAEIASALVAGANAVNIDVTATGASSPVTLTSNDPSFNVTAVSNVTVAQAQTTYAPNGTPGTAIRSTVAPNGTAATAVSGTATVTVATAAAHGLLPGDVVDLSGAATFQFLDLRPGSNQAAAAAVSDVVIATVPTATTFTLQGVAGNGGANSGTLVIRTKNVVTVETLAAHGLVAGNAVTVAGIATMTVNGGASFTSVVRSVPATDELVLIGVANASANSGTITISSVPQLRKNYGADLAPLFNVTLGGLGGNINTKEVNLGDTPVATEGYTKISLQYEVPAISSPGNIQSKNTRIVNLYLNETYTGYPEALKRVGEIVNNWAFNTQLANANAGAL